MPVVSCEYPVNRLFQERHGPLIWLVAEEECQGMVALGITNSRMKDFFDLWVLACGFSFHGARLCRAIRPTFRRRKTALPPETRGARASC